MISTSGEVWIKKQTASYLSGLTINLANNVNVRSMICRRLTRAFLESQDHAPPIGSTSHEGGSCAGGVNVDVSDAGVGIIALGVPVHDGHNFAGSYDREYFADGLYDRPSRYQR
jgi:hypothetical protein